MISRSPFDDYCHAATEQPTFAQLQARAEAQNLARYLRDASLSDLANLTGALAAEMLRRGIQVAGPLGTVAARVEARAEEEANR